MKLRNKKILVTGGSGFIGENLIKALIAVDAKVHNFDLSTGLDIENLSHLKRILKEKFDVVFHLAGFSGPTASNQNIAKSFKVNTIATVNLCQLITKYSPQAKFIFSSSRLEYGKPQYLPVDENHSTTPNSAYGLSKLAASQMVMVFAKRNGLNATIFRTSNAYGPHPVGRLATYNIINYFIDLARAGKILTIYGKGNQIRDYIYIDDLINAFLLAAEEPNISRGQIYNLGYGQGIEFGKMINLIRNKVGNGKAKIVPWPPDYSRIETGSYISDISKIKKHLGFSPQINFEKGLEKTIASK